MKRSILVAVVAACVLAFALPSLASGVTIPAPPYNTAEDCLACHAVQNSGPVVHTVDFSVPLVNRTTCNKCHWIAPHPSHNSGDRCARCHNSWPYSGNSLPYTASVNLGAFGKFSASNSASLDGPALHAIHSRREWPADVTSRGGTCSSCHAPAACDACHVTVPHDAHPTQNPVAPVAQVSPGTTPNVLTATAYTTPISCAAAACHGGIGAERTIEDNDSSITRTGTWASLTDAQSGYTWSGGTVLSSNTVGSRVSFPFTGSQVSVYGYTGYGAGAVAIYVDGILVDTRDLRDFGANAGCGFWFSNNLSPGAHTLELEVRAGAYGATNVYVDRIVARDLVAPANLSPTCSSCHADRVQAHAANHVAAVTSTVEPVGGNTCGDCHAMDLVTEHVKTSSAGLRSCTTCHPTPRDTITSAWDRTCQTAGCHIAAPDIKHANIAAKHAVPAAGAVCAGCHNAGDLAAIHSTATTTTPTGVRTGCLVCHDKTTVPATSDCTVCHFAMGNHPNASHTSTFDLRSCDATGCHTPTSVTSTGTISALVPIHTEHNAAFTCADCHSSTNVAVKAAITAGNTNCDACHGAISGAAPHRDLHPANPALVDGSGPHYAYVTGSAPGGSYTSDCAGCHTSNLVDEHVGLTIGGSVVVSPRHDSAGNALTCATCHSSVRGDIIAAIGAGKTNCDACHVVHAPIPALHASTYKVNPEVPCADCHSADLTVVHNNGMAVTTPNGTTLTGCALCHDYTTNQDSTVSTMGARVQAAIRGGVSLCTACHLSYHGNGGSKHVATSPQSVDPNTGCALCHTGANVSGGIDVTVMHNGVTTPGPCSVCHNNKPRIPDITLKTAECASCHTITSATGAGHTGLPVKHTSPTITAGCQGSGCHSPDLPTTHNPYMSRFPQFATSCALCHKNPSRIPDITQKTAACDSCHPGGAGAHIGIHVATDSVTVGCEACHELPAGGDIASLHAGSPLGPCNVCHANPTGGDLTMVSPGVRKANAACAQAGCHAGKDPIDPNHYPAPNHADTQSSTVDSTIGSACGTCHSMDLKAEHFKATSKMPDGTSITCAKCHESAKFLALPDANPGIGRTWNGTCEQCHTTKHAGMSSATAHNAGTVGIACAGAGCHNTADLASIHTSATVTVGGVAYNGCNVCHQSATVTPASNNCLTCHPSATPTHKTEHNTAGQVDPGCAGCHFTNLIDEHVTSGLKSPTTGLAMTCATCHTPTLGAAAKTAIAAAIAAGDESCDACHPAVNGKNTHAGQNTNEFVATNASMHRVNASLPGMRSSFVVNGTTYTWSLPSSGWLKSPWTTNSVVTCDACHTFSTTVAGPHGAAVTVNIDPAYPGDYTTARLSSSRSSGTSGAICDKCHQNYTSMNEVHGESDHSGDYCTDCHVGVPHGWRLPRLLAYTSDPAPYKSNHLTGLRLTNHSANNWSESDCAASCEEHSSSMSSRWPSSPLVVGTLGGTVTNATGVPMPLASVSLSNGATGTTDANGNYYFGGLSGGNITVTVSRGGYVTQSKTITIASGQTGDADFVLQQVQYGSVAGKITDSVTGSPISGATVSCSSGASMITAADGSYAMSNIVIGSYTLTVSKAGYTTKSQACTVVANVTSTSNVLLAAASFNAAKSKMFTASKSGSSNPPSYAGDGSYSTYWATGGLTSSTQTQWLQGDLGAVYPLNKIVVRWNGNSAYARAYSVQVSADGTNWTTVYSTTSGSSSSRTVTFTTVNARYVKVNCTQYNSSSSGYRIYELEAWTP